MSFATQFAGPDNSPGFLLWRVANEWQRRQRSALEPLGLTHVQFVVLAGAGWFTAARESVTQAELARHIRTDEMMTSQVVRILEKRGLLTRVPHPTDARARCVAIAPAGSELLRQALPVVEATDSAFFAPVAPSTCDLAAGFRLLLAPP